MKKILKKILERFGYRIVKNSDYSIQNENPFLATKDFFNTITPVVFDIGMNHGQTIKKIKTDIPNAIIHGFEASKYCFEIIKKNIKTQKGINLNNLAVGDEVTKLEFNEYSWDAMNSFLERAYGSAKIVDKYLVDVITIDKYCEQNAIKNIHLLKSDTEGFELKVLKGAKQMMNNNAIKFIHIELFFDLNFIGQSSVGEIFSYLEKNNFVLAKFYDFSNTKEGLASKSDALFINLKFDDAL
ncbi:FkbM family methyltransferase [Lacinutrix algicola]|uniref:FkbM family methyltransferase n=1 Tax=Lacinutrix algicola TaxID=342954 RepID=UPI0006E1F1A2|nr:FkbM family methyltransferase [Lacinutrix algicola]